ncbi:endolytic transglycosylase MltG [Arenibacter sp. GZD96]|uniref:endolytic transglycosylase MltG n=1 Tax=Aurantibrevibacter litoralis TaxID=3106030 RepID=UPI002AFF223D|nr:endolytic transglycosylase MltG [Arenibacter sp. GZD-96]MEA1786320.1 endolytic transglycosylase MltG [Arenibacter sp. GZD-96]
MYLKKIVWLILLIGLLCCGAFAYMVYQAIFSSNTTFSENEVVLYIPTGTTFDEMRPILDPYIEDLSTFEKIAQKKGYTANIKGGKYVLRKGMSNNDMINTLRNNNIPVKVSFNNQETVSDLAGRIASQIEADSVSLLTAFNELSYLDTIGFNAHHKLSLYIPNSYEFFWNTSATQFRERMRKEYDRFWNEERLQKASKLGLTPLEISTLASIVHKETAKVDERPRVAGVYLNRLRKGMLLQADPTVIYALKLHSGDFNTVYKRVLYKDLTLDSPYNTYKYAGLPPGPIAMPDITAIDAVLNPEAHDYLYFVANVTDFGYHKFAKTLTQHNKNKEEYVRWINSQQIKR